MYPLSFSNIKHVPGNHEVTSFEFMEVAISIQHQTLRIVVVYRPSHVGTDRIFLEEFGSFVEHFSSKDRKLLIVGDFNYWIDNPPSKPFSTEFLELVGLNNFLIHTMSPTHTLGQSLDLVLTPNVSNIVENLDIVPLGINISDNFLVNFNLNIKRPPSYMKTISFRNYRRANQEEIICEVHWSLNSFDTIGLSADQATDAYDNFFRAVSNNHRPIVVKHILVKDDAPWYDSSVADLTKRRQAELRNCAKGCCFSGIFMEE